MMPDKAEEEHDSIHHRALAANSRLYAQLSIEQTDSDTDPDHNPFVELRIIVDSIQGHDEVRPNDGLVTYSPGPNSAATFKPTWGQIERETNSMQMFLGISLLSVMLDLFRQLTSYSLKYYNEDVYPVPPTLLVFLAELLKFFIFVVKLLRDGQLTAVKLSLAYSVPALLYSMNANIYFIALLYTTPPVWNVLMQVRVIMTAVVYRFFFKKLVTKTQWLALVILTLSIGILQFSDSNDGTESDLNVDVIMALVLAALASVCATIGPIYAEYLLKNDPRTFDDKQFQIYLFGSFISGAMAMLQSPITADSLTPIMTMKGNPMVLQPLIFAVITLTAACGIVVAVIMKKLDNIVKLYTQAMSSGLTCLACIFLFPRLFQFDILFIASLIMTSFSIYLYERKSFKCKRVVNNDSQL